MGTGPAAASRVRHGDPVHFWFDIDDFIVEAVEGSWVDLYMLVEFKSIFQFTVGEVQLGLEVLNF